MAIESALSLPQQLKVNIFEAAYFPLMPSSSTSKCSVAFGGARRRPSRSASSPPAKSYERKIAFGSFSKPSVFAGKTPPEVVFSPGQALYVAGQVYYLDVAKQLRVVGIRQFLGAVVLLAIYLAAFPALAAFFAFFLYHQLKLFVFS